MPRLGLNQTFRNIPSGGCSERIKMALENEYPRIIHRKNYNHCFVNVMFFRSYDFIFNFFALLSLMKFCVALAFLIELHQAGGPAYYVLHPQQFCQL